MDGICRKKRHRIYSVYSIFDESKQLTFTPIPRSTEKIKAYMNDRGTTTLFWFSRGYYTVSDEDDNLIFYDLRFGRDDLWLAEDGQFIWKNKIIFNENDEAHTFELTIPSFDTRSQNLSRYWNRIWGE